MIKSPLGVGGSGVFSVSGGVSGGGASPIASSHSKVNNNNGSVSAARFSVEQHGLQSGSNGVSNQCLDSAANVLPDSPPVSTVAALARITNTVAHDESFASKRRRLQHSHGVSGPGPLSFSTPTFCNVLDRGFSFESSSFASAQSSRIGMVGHLGLPRGLAIGDDDGAVAGVPCWLTRLFHPPER